MRDQVLKIAEIKEVRDCDCYIDKEKRHIGHSWSIYEEIELKKESLLGGILAD